MKVNELITWPTLCVFGDSIVVGSDDREAGGWVARLKLDLNARGKIGVYNLGVDGDRTEQLLRRLADNAQVASMLAAFQAGFHHAARVALIAVFIAQMYLHSRNVIAQVAQRALHYSTDLGDQSLVAFDVMVGIDLNLHGILP